MFVAYIVQILQYIYGLKNCTVHAKQISSGLEAPVPVLDVFFGMKMEDKYDSVPGK